MLDKDKFKDFGERAELIDIAKPDLLALSLRSGVFSVDGAKAIVSALEYGLKCIATCLALVMQEVPGLDYSEAPERVVEMLGVNPAEVLRQFADEYDAVIADNIWEEMVQKMKNLEIDIKAKAATAKMPEEIFVSDIL